MIETPFHFNILEIILYDIDCTSFEINKNVHKIIALLVNLIDYFPKDSRLRRSILFGNNQKTQGKLLPHFCA